MNSRVGRAFALLFLGLALGVAGFAFLITRGDENGVPWPLRKVLNLNDRISIALFHPDRVAPLERAPPPGKEVRQNGDIGLDDDLDPETWRLQIIPPLDSQRRGKPLSVSMAEIRAMPRTESTALFKCIEGWSDPIAYAGVRFSDFLHYLHLDDVSSQAAYVGLATPDGKYYVSIDMESMLHFQTLLAFEMNSRPLSPEDGAPLRLIIPIKYGIKSLKRIGTIRLANQRPPDYWNEQGYDWFAGL